MDGEEGDDSEEELDTVNGKRRDFESISELHPGDIKRMRKHYTEHTQVTVQLLQIFQVLPRRLMVLNIKSMCKTRKKMWETSS